MCPRTAVSGPVALVSADGFESAPTAVPLTIDTAAPPAITGTGDSLGIDVEVQGNRVFYGAERTAQVSYLVRGSQPANVAIELVRLSDGVAITRWEPGLVPPEIPQMVTWDGTAWRQGAARRPLRLPRLRAVRVRRHRVLLAGAARGGPEGPAPGSFMFQRNIFPIRGPHTVGTGAAAFGGGRGHQGQDVFAKCGTPLVAATAGVVKFKRFQSRAGNYLVIDGDRTSYDYAYMHLRDAALVEQGDHVYTGQPVGFVGATGHADGCHLHFEVWTGPGWYSGGHVIDPLPLLQTWDKVS